MTNHHFRSFVAAAALLAGPLVAGAQTSNTNTSFPIGPGGGAPDYTAPVPLPMPMMSGATRFDPNHKLQPGDTLAFKIEQDKDPAVPLIVSPGGDVTVEPLPNAVHVQGMSPSSAAAEIKRALDKDYYYNATVRLTLERVNATATMGYIYLSGNVARTGAVPIFDEQPKTVSQVILETGGFGRWANDRKVQVTRPRPDGTAELFILDCKKIIKEGHPELDRPAKAGDRIFVPETGIKFN
jgi:protein involved in polysaccharide export with SLBB domain